MCLEISKVFKCGCKVVVRNIFCPASADHTLCEPVETMKKHHSQRCPPCYRRLAQGWNTTTAKAAPKPEMAPATAVKSNPALAADMPVGGSSKRKAAPEPEQERPAKKANKAKTEAEIKREHELEQKVDERKKQKKQKKLEYQRQYRQKQDLQKKRKQEQVVVKAMARVAEAMDLAQRAGAEAAALARARAEAQAQAEHDEELEADLNAAFDEEEICGEEPALTLPPAPKPAAPLVEYEVKGEDEDELNSEWEFDRDSSFSDPDSSLVEPTLLELRGEPLRYLMPVAELVPCHGYYCQIPSLQPHSTPKQAHCCANCFQLEHVDEDGIATLMRAYDMFDGGYWSEG